MGHIQKINKSMYTKSFMRVSEFSRRFTFLSATSLILVKITFFKMKVYLIILLLPLLI